MQAVSLNPEIRIVVDRRITPEHRSQSRRLDRAEGSSPCSLPLVRKEDDENEYK